MKVKDLSNDELREIIEEYYENNITVKALLEKHGVVYTSNFIQSVTLYTDEECELCGSKIKYKLESRTYCDSVNNLKRICSSCGHDGTKNCHCKACIEYRRVEMEKKQEEKRKIVRELFTTKPVTLDEVSIKELIFIGLLKDRGIGYNIGVLAEKDYFKNTHSYIEDSMEFLKAMLENGTIKVNVDESDLNYFILEEDKSISYYPYSLSYSLNLNSDIRNIDVKKELIKRFQYEDIEACWLEICIDECMKYLDIRTVAMNLGVIDNVIKKDIYSFLEDILMEYSLGIVINIIYKSVNYASNFKVEYDVEIEKVHKAIYTNMKNNILRQYSKIPFDRPYELVQTSLSQYICDNIFERDSDEIFKLGFSINELYCIDEKRQQEKETDPVKEGLETYNKLVLQIKELVANNVPKDFIIDYLKITEEIYNSAVNKSNDNY
ncbi:hypothetical protein [Clostridium sp. 'White wine YQ']|uniref:hypothetical protein n=1 Tax=Clostridium sp. 'White wine YQ' TaxID=3027474 RepID=UPI0023664C51|nr:hypothetical protein [Clostridium sp. 'White wine YQ']MDD7796308.1 hypothetical protein [Clostridium sp. 'White wine YQ']